jgi:putative methyltransferase (TIGR04325 family)
MFKFRKKRTAALPEWEYVPGTWAEALKGRNIRGWDAEGVVRTQTDAWPGFLASIAAPRAFGLSTNPGAAGDLSFHNSVMSFAYVMSLTRQKTGGTELSILDWGGGLGQYYRIARELFPELGLKYTCKEMSKLCQAGSRLNPEAYFTSDEQVCGDSQFDLVMASTSLHYSPDWPDVMRRLVRGARHYVFINRLPTVERHASYIMIQRPYKYGYDTEYIGWCLNQGEFLACAEQAGARLKRTFLCGEGSQVKVQGAPEQAFYRGFLFAKQQAGNN